MVAAPARLALEPATRIQFLPGVGPARARRFESLGLHTLEQLVRHYPRAWLDARQFVRIADVTPGTLLTVDGTIKHAAAVRTRGGRADFNASIVDGSGTLGLYFFGQPFLARTLAPGTRIVVSGELDALDRRMKNPLFEVVEDDVAELLHVGRLVPVHALTRGISARILRRAVRVAIDAVGARVVDPLPTDIVAAQGLSTLAEALEHIHFPPDEPARERARRRLAFEELFMVQSVLALRRRALREEGRGLAQLAAGTLAARARAALPYTLTADQSQALDEIRADLEAPRAMQRMLLGDVGSGKTVVAALAALHVIEAGRQAAFMAPTEILAQQHAATLGRVCAPAAVAVELLTGSTPAAARRAVQKRLDAGEAVLVVGTHALLEEAVRMPQLGLAIVDEQHRFGVRQRAELTRKSVMPDVLVMTATPIPRTLVLAQYGDLDVSRLHTRPAGRGRRVTRIAGEEKFPQVIEFMARELAAGRQAFVVVPLIETAGAREARAAEDEHQRLSAQPRLRDHRVGLLHGRLTSDEKQRVMQAFAAGEIQVLVTTTVIEVGVDVPNATLMVIENAERFGLTQLHQLRGRVGRSEHRSVCVLVPGAASSPSARARLDVLVQSDDGFEIAEADLRMRGSGELWGTRQSGIPQLVLADPATDQGLLTDAADAARRLAERDPWLRDPAHQALGAALRHHYRDAIDLAGGG